jgi:hypothetical protein
MQNQEVKKFLQEAIDFTKKEDTNAFFTQHRDLNKIQYVTLVQRLKQLSTLSHHFGNPTFLKFLYNSIVDELEKNTEGGIYPKKHVVEKSSTLSKFKDIMEMEETSVPVPKLYKQNKSFQEKDNEAQAIVAEMLVILKNENEKEKEKDSEYYEMLLNYFKNKKGTVSSSPAFKTWASEVERKELQRNIVNVLHRSLLHAVFEENRK